MSDFQISKRRKARSLALQALYQWSISGENLSEIEIQFHAHNNMQKVDTEYFHELLHKIPQQLNKVDAKFTPHLDRKLEELTPIELIILRIGTYELSHRPDVPYKVVLNEAVELSKSFGTDEGHKYVNGVLDKVAREVRVNEF